MRSALNSKQYISPALVINIVWKVTTSLSLVYFIIPETFFKAILHLKITSVVIYSPHDIPKPYDLPFSVVHERYFKKCLIVFCQHKWKTKVSNVNIFLCVPLQKVIPVCNDMSNGKNAVKYYLEIIFHVLYLFIFHLWYVLYFKLHMKEIFPPQKWVGVGMVHAFKVNHWRCRKRNPLQSSASICSFLKGWGEQKCA